MNKKITYACAIIGGAAIGFTTCGVIVAKKILQSERMREALVKVVVDKLDVVWKNPSMISYRSYYDSYKPRPYQVENIVFETRAEAEKVLDSMDELMKKYNIVTVADYYDLCDIQHDDHLDKHNGWIDISGVEVLRISEGYKLTLPAPKVITD